MKNNQQPSSTCATHVMARVLGKILRKPPRLTFWMGVYAALTMAIVATDATHASNTGIPARDASSEMRAIPDAGGMITVGKKRIKAPPKKPGCYRHRADWEEVPCLSREEVSKLSRPWLGLIEAPPPSSYVAPYGAQLDVSLLAFGTETDSQTGNNGFSLQLNSNSHLSTNGQKLWTQFLYQNNVGTSNGTLATVLCIWNVNTSTNDYGQSDGNTTCVGVNAFRAPQKGDTAGMGAYESDGTLYLNAVLPWTDDSNGQTADAYSVSMPDVYNLEANSNWNAVDGGMLGAGNTSVATFTKSCVTTSLKMYFANVNTIPRLMTGRVLTTLESNNLVTTNAFSISPLPPAITPPNVLSTCNDVGTCSAVYDEVSPDWTTAAVASCYPQDIPAPALPPGAEQGVFEDDSTQLSMGVTKTHICPGAALLIGVDAAHNRFLCSSSFLLPNNTAPIVDTSTSGVFRIDNRPKSIHVCPANSAMIGWNRGQNWLLCTPLPPSGYVTLPKYGTVKVNRRGNTQVPEPKHPSLTMQSCDASAAGLPWAVVGIDTADNVLVCMNSEVTPRLQ
jgi:hypothetical protein